MSSEDPEEGYWYVGNDAFDLFCLNNAEQLAQDGMIVEFDEYGYFTITDLGRTGGGEERP